MSSRALKIILNTITGSNYMKTYTMPKDTVNLLCYLSDANGNTVAVFNHPVKDIKLTTLRKTKFNIDLLTKGEKYHAL